MSRIEDMFESLQGARPEVLPSRYWQELNRTNLQQLEEHGYESFKRTLGLNYFTFLVLREDVQLNFLRAQLPQKIRVHHALGSILRGKHPGLNWKQSLLYTYHTLLLWEYAARTISGGILQSIEEPREGGPFEIRLRGKHISQDLANSALEFHSIMAPLVRRSEIRTILELGAGYGRTAYVFLTLMPGTRYIIVDIPPALYIAERYLCNQFPNRRPFRFRPFHAFEEVKQEFQNADLVFLLSNQLDLLPAGCVDLFINISSLHEMRMDQIRYFFDAIDRLTTHFFYSKQWKLSTVPYEDIQIGEEDYPVKPEWEEVFHRDCNVQTQFFEALYRL